MDHQIDKQKFLLIPLKSTNNKRDSEESMQRVPLDMVLHARKNRKREFKTHGDGIGEWKSDPKIL